MWEEELLVFYVLANCSRSFEITFFRITVVWVRASKANIDLNGKMCLIFHVQPKNRSILHNFYSSMRSRAAIHMKSIVDLNVGAPTPEPTPMCDLAIIIIVNIINVSGWKE